MFYREGFARGWSWLVGLGVASVLATGLAAQKPRADQSVAGKEPVAAAEGRLEQVGPTAWRVVPDKTPYNAWLAKNKARLPYWEGIVIQDGRVEPLEPWPDLGTGIRGLYLRMADYQITDGWLVEIPPHGSTKPMKHAYEAGIYFLNGPGHTMIQQTGKQPQRVDWKYRSLFAIPINATYEHFNDSDTPVRMLVVTSFPFVINSTNSEKFVFENPYSFTDRYNGEEDYLRKSEHTGPNQTVTNFVADALGFKLDSYDRRGKGTTNMHWQMAGNTMVDFHVSEMPGGEYKRAHRHSSDAFILLLSGEGYSLTWPEGQYDKRVRVNWTEGTIFVPPIYWYHQHLNPGKESARYLAMNAPELVTRLGLRFEDQIEPDMPQIAQEFKNEVAQRRTGGTR